LNCKPKETLINLKNNKITPKMASPKIHLFCKFAPKILLLKQLNKTIFETNFLKNLRIFYGEEFISVSLKNQNPLR